MAQQGSVDKTDTVCEENKATYPRTTNVVSPTSMAAMEPETMRRDIAHTRAEMTETVGEIRTRLSPDRLREQARQATIGRARDAMYDARDQAEEAGQSMLATIRRNPVPTALVAIGLGWLIMDSRRPKGYVPARYSPVRSRARQVAGRVQERAEEMAEDAEATMLRAKLAAEEAASEVGERVRDATESIRDTAKETASQFTERVHGATEGVSERFDETRDQADSLTDEARARAEELRMQAKWQTRRVRSQVGAFIDENPLAAGAIALAVGAAVGMMVPETPVEDRLMGEQRDRLMTEAQDRARDTAERARHVAEEAAQAAREAAEEEAKRQDLVGGEETQEQRKTA